MKITAKMGEGRFLVEMTDQEIAQVCGLDLWKDRGALHIGAEYPAAEVCRDVKRLRDQRDQVERAATHMRTLADMLEREIETLAQPLPQPAQ